ncbi:MAG: hypothetical protein U1F29_13975 [Planctomycetota bacterium]
MTPRIPFLVLVCASVPVAARAGNSDDSRFSALDGELDALARTLQHDSQSGPTFGALLRVAYDDADSDLSATADDVSGFRMYDAQVWFDSKVGDYEVFVKMDAGETSAFPAITGDGVGAFGLRDAWARTNVTDQLQLYWGQYKCPLVQSGNVGDGKLSFIDRTRIGQLFSAPGAYQPGAALVGDFDAFHFKLAVQNGADGASDGWGIVARGEYQVGEGAKAHEGAYGAPAGFNGTFGLGYFKDDSQIGGSDFGSAWAADAYLTYDAFSFEAEILDADEELASRALGNTTDDATPWDVTAGYLFGEGKYEALVRYQDLDNEIGATIVGAGFNYYVNGHATKWQVNASKYDDDAIDGTILQLGLSIGIDSPH